MKSAFGVDHTSISKGGLGTGLGHMITGAFKRARKPGEALKLQVPDNIPGFKTLEPTSPRDLPKRPTMPEAKVDDTSRAVQQEIDARTGEALRAPAVDVQHLTRPPAQAAPAAPKPAASTPAPDDEKKVKGKYYALAGILGTAGAGTGAYAYDKKKRATKGA